MSLQICHCGWSKVTTYQGLRIHQGKKGCTTKGLRIPENIPQISYFSPTLLGIFPPYMRSGAEETWINALENHHQRETTQLIRDPITLPINLLPTSSGTNKVRSLQMIQSLMENQQPSLQNTSSQDRSIDFSSDLQPIQISPVLETLSYQANLEAMEVKEEATNRLLFETPPRASDYPTTARRALSFSSGAQQAEQMDRNIPTTTAQEQVVRPKQREREKEMEKEIEKERETERKKEQEKERKKEEEKQKQIKARQVRIKAYLQQNLQLRERKKEEVRSSAKACKGSLDTEWLEINSVFADVINVVEKARKDALRPLEERRQKVKLEEQNLILVLQTEIDKLKNIIDELDQNPGLQVSPPEEAWKNLSLDTSFSFGSLRTTTSKMKKKIEQTLETLSSLELKRMQNFAVNVKLDATTAHPCLDLSPDGKQVRDRGENQRVTDYPERFDRFGSILGSNGLTSGKSYWEVEVRNKTGWDLGVTRVDANRKGQLSLTPDNGYWVAVHFERAKYAAMTAPPTSLSLTSKPQKVGVFVDHQEGLVSFYDVRAQSHIYSFTDCLFNGEIFPYFSPHLNRNGENFDPLIISAVTKQE